MSRSRVVVSALAVLMVLSLVLSSTGYAQAQAPFPEEPLPVPVYPSYSHVTTKTPSFYFFPHSTATKYRIKVIDEYSSAEIYVFKGMPTCEPSEPPLPCWMTPDTLLKVMTFGPQKGRYTWELAAKVGGEWKPYSEPAHFYIAQSGFDSDFSTDAKKWVNIEGDWTVANGYYKNAGPANTWTSAAQKQYAYGEYTYEAKIRLKSGMPEEHQGGIIVNGDPGERLPGSSEWYSGYYFLYRNNQNIAIFKREYKAWVPIVDWTVTDLVLPGDWNTLKVEMGYTEVKFYINGTLFHTITSDLLPMGGWAGVTQYRAYPEIKESMRVDWATLTLLHP